MRNQTTLVRSNNGGDRMVVRTTIVLLLSLCIIGSGVRNTIAHNIDVAKAREKAREYGRKKRFDPNRKYARFQTDCVAKFPGHNHVVVCAISFDTAENLKRNTTEWSCSETIEVYYQPHFKNFPLKDLEYTTMLIRHTSANDC